MPTQATPTDPNAAAVPASFEERVKAAWERNGNFVYLVLGVLAAAVLAKGGLDYYSAQKEVAIQQDYAACTAPDMLKAFAESHKGHPLAGLAELRVADLAYAGGRFGEAATDYSQAAGDIAAGPLQSRAKLGLAMSQAESGKPTDAEAGLRLILGDTSELKPIRCEAAYHLASLELSQGRSGEIEKLTEELMQIDPSSPFAERMAEMRSSVPAAAGPMAIPSLAPLGH
jgi:predicted negative regulator of RcsB-dependent stress response